MGLVRHLSVEIKSKRMFLVFWGYVKLSQIFIYYNLILGTILVLLLYSDQNSKKNLLVILIASILEGFSKIKLDTHAWVVGQFSLFYGNQV